MRDRTENATVRQPWRSNLELEVVASRKGKQVQGNHNNTFKNNSPPGGKSENDTEDTDLKMETVNKSEIDTSIDYLPYTWREHDAPRSNLNKLGTYKWVAKFKAIGAGRVLGNRRKINRKS